MHYRVYICQQEWKLPHTLNWNTRGKFSEAVPITTTFWVLLHEYVRIQLTSVDLLTSQCSLSLQTRFP